jgi:two-component system KDP operon response regulator KdpE
VDLIRRIRAWSSVPIIVLSARTAEEQKIAALDAGADDYVIKPFAAAELLARVRAALRRTATGVGRSATISLGGRVIDLARREVIKGDRDLHLTPLEYRVLENLARHPGTIVKQDALIREVWGPAQVGDTRSLRVCIRNLRAKLETEPTRPRYIVTEAGVGYRLRLDEDH